MNARTNEGTRANARFYGITFHCLAILTICATLFAAAKVAKAGSDLGVQPSNDPAPWVILVVGILAALLLTGFGSALGILCAIYDRQESIQGVPGALRVPIPSPSPIAPNTSSSRPIASAPTIHEAYRIKPEVDKPSITNDAQSAKAQTPSASKATSVLWGILTKERHFFSDGKHERNP